MEDLPVKMISATDSQMPNKMTFAGFLGRIGIILLILIIAISVLGFTVMNTIINDPSKAARDLFVTTCMETSFAKIFPPLYLSEAQILDIQQTNTVIETNEVTDIATEFEKPIEDNTADIIVEDVIGATYKGKMMIVKDPSRIVVGTPNEYGPEVTGEKLLAIIEKENAVAGINGGGFADENGVGNGGTPLGFVIKNSKFLCNEGSSGNLIGFDENNVLHVGTMTTEQIKERKIRDAVSFGPPLIINSKPSGTLGSGGGLNPRSAIGQRADGAVLLLAIDGRQPHSLGANFKDLVDIMTEYGAVNAGNLDGGSSTMLYHNGELINTCASLYGPRKIPSAFIVK